MRKLQKPVSNEGNPEAIYMYPPAVNYLPAPEFSSDIPDPLLKAFVSTVDAFNASNYVATAVCCRRTLEGIFKYLVPEDQQKKPLDVMIRKVADEKDLAAPLSSLSHAIRSGGNLGAHFDAEKEPTFEMAREMVKLLQYLIEYLYVLPQEIEKLEASLGGPSGQSGPSA